jgi:hypothetical protein
MIKGFEVSINLLITVILLLFTIGIFWSSMVGKGPAPLESGEVEQEQVCKGDDDCPGSQKCIRIYPGNFTSFCGCLLNVDCNGGICGSNNRCI